MSHTKLLPCPFCGAVPESSVIGEAARYLLLCDTCGVTTAYHEGINATIAAWNTRTPHPAVAALEAVEKLFASPGYYIGTREGADPLAIDATMLLVAQAVRAAKGGA